MHGIQTQLFGEDVKAVGQRVVLNNQDEGWIRKAKTVVSKASAIYERFTADDVRLVGGKEGLGCPTHRNVWGALLSGCARAGLIRRTGQYRKSYRPSNRGRMLAVWERAR